jgi:phosphoribosylanthranilate isomerase
MKLKICGLSNPKDVKACVMLNVNYCGFILNYPKSHRYVSFNKAKNLTNINKGNTKYVGVLVNPTDEELFVFSKLNFDYFQLYGIHDSKMLLKIKKKINKKIISTIQVKKKKDIDKYKLIEKISDIILWDSSGYEKSLSWNYKWIKSISTNAEKMIAGNITVEKIADLRGLVDIIDVSGAVETNKVKDINKINKIITEIKKIRYEN